MKIYNVYVKKDSEASLETAKFVREGGFSIFAGIFQVFWALYKKMWFCAAFVFLAHACLVAIEKSGYLTYEATLVLRLGFFVFLGFSANDWFKSDLENKGYIMTDIVAASDKSEAKAKFMYSLAN